MGIDNTPVSYEGPLSQAPYELPFDSKNPSSPTYGEVQSLFIVAAGEEMADELREYIKGLENVPGIMKKKYSIFPRSLG